MRVSLEEIPEVTLGNNGIVVRIRTEAGANLGKLRIGQANVRWARGRVPWANAKVLSVQEFVDYLNALP